MYKKFTLEERKKIEEMLKQGYSCIQMGKILNRHPSSIQRDVKVNGGRLFYDGEKAHEKCLKGILKNGRPRVKEMPKDINFGKEILEIKDMLEKLILQLTGKKI